MTCTSSSCRTVTGTCRPSAWNRRVIPTFFAITPVRMTKLLKQRHTGPFPECVQPIDFLRAPPGLVLLTKGAAGTQPGASLRRYHPVLPREGRRPSGQFDLHVDTGGEIELHQSIDRLRRGLHDIEQPL